MKLRYVAPVLFCLSCASGADEPSSIEAHLAANARAYGHAPVCGPVGPDGIRCHSRVLVDADDQPLVTAGPRGYGPPQLLSAYGLATVAATGGSGQTIGIVDAYDNPNAEADLGVYRAQYGLPPCTTANGCFKKVNQKGVQGSYPLGNTSWGQEIALDVQMASAICPNCKILLVEASSASLANLGAAVNTAVALGATVVSNSYGGKEYLSETTDESLYFNHPGVPITVSSGDSGYGVEFPAASRYVTAVGGTHLVPDGSTRGWSETAWSGAGSGCSAYVGKPAWQTDAGCARRTVADVSAVADPYTGVAVYDSYGKRNQTGWLVFGGTSVAAPVIAGVYALAANQAAPSYPYANATALNDVTAGSNGSCGGYLCTSLARYDGPTGLGTPSGTGAF
jgi:subtilase family serine protease